MATATKKTTRQPAAKAAPAKATPVETAPVKTASVKTAPVKAAAAIPVKADKPKKPKLVRDSFTIPKNEYGVIEKLKERAARLGKPSKKSEVLRAGVKALEAMPDAAFLACIGGVPSIKTGRPAKS